MDWGDLEDESAQNEVDFCADNGGWRRRRGGVQEFRELLLDPA